ncbi:MAG: hypothetical protein P8170_16305 [Gemmatimonadota bacterium]
MDPIDAITAAPSTVEEPIRAEVFGIERLEQHAESLATAQRTVEGITKGRPLISTVSKNGQSLLAAYHNIVEAVREKSEITSAEEWLLDNFYVVDEQLREIRDHLPGSYYHLLPKIAVGHLEGYPRVYGLAWPTSPIPTAGSRWNHFSDSSGPTSAFSRSPSERSGR